MSDNPTKDFVFVGEALALDLVNTVVIVRGRGADLLDTPHDLADWWALAAEHHPEAGRVRGPEPVFEQPLLDAVRTLRDSLRGLFVSVIQGHHPEEADIHRLNTILRMAHPALEWGPGPAPEAVYGNHGDPHFTLLLPAALSAHTLLTTADPARLHQCHNHRCILLFYDTTRSGTRQWCTTACFDRERAAERYQQRRQLE